MTSTPIGRKSRFTAMLALASLYAITASAQEMRGTIVQSDSTTPASGAVVLLMHATTDSIYARTVTGERGLYLLKAPGPMTVRLRVLRIGYQPTNAGTFTLAAGQIESRKVVLGDKRVLLASFDVKTANRCEVRPDSGLLVAQLYEEARKALMASASSVSNVRNTAQFTLYTRAQDVRGKLVSPIERNAFSGPSSRPFASLPADSLAKVGYVVETVDGTYYRAPDADVLLANSFLAAHCLQFVQGTGERAASVGIGFRPVGRRRNLVDVKGTLWLDRETNELQFLEYTYDGVPDDYAKLNVGGRVEYTQMAAGLWFVNRWAIRMPRFVARSNQRLDGMRGEMVNAVDLAGLHITGGEVQSVKVDEDLLYTNSGAALAGSEPRDLQDLRVFEGSFAVAAEAQLVTELKAVRSVDSVFSTSACNEATSADYTGQVQGRVRDVENKNTEAFPVIAEWKEDFRVSGQRDFTWQYRRLETKTKPNGTYVLCGLPLSRAVTLTATNNGRKSRVATVRVSEKAPRTSMDIAIGDKIGTVLTAADIRGKGAMLVVSDMAGKPVPYAVVALNGGATRIADKNGQVLVPMAPRDSLKVLSRRMGLMAFDGVALRDSANGAFRITMLPSAQELKAVAVKGVVDRSILERTGFYERAALVHRGATVGDFITPEMIELRSFARVSQIVEQSRYVSVKNFAGVARAVTGRNGCYMNVIIDGKREKNLETMQTIYKMGPADTINPSFNTGRSQTGTGMTMDDLVAGNNVMAIEVYPTAALAPFALSSLLSDNTGCGIIAIWTGAR